MRRWRWVLAFVILAAVVALVLIWRSEAASSDLDGRFASITAGMSRSEVERLLGPPANPADETIRRVAGFRAVDHPGLDKQPRPSPIRVWWHDGRQRCLYVDFSGDGVWQAKLFAPGWSRSLSESP